MMKNTRERVKKNNFIILLGVLVVLVVCLMGVEKSGVNAEDSILGNSSIPTTVEQLAGNNKTLYVISTYQDWMNLQALSQITSLEGYEFTISSNETPSAGISSQVYDLTTIKQNDERFTGIGSQAFPFKGNINVTKESGTSGYKTGVQIKTNVPLFSYLSPKANIQSLYVVSEDATSGLAQVLVVDADQQGDITTQLSDIWVEGRIYGGNKPAGGLFGEVINASSNSKLRIAATVLNENQIVTNTSVGIKLLGSKIPDYDGRYYFSVSGKVAGGLIGSAEGNVVVEYDGVTITGLSDGVDILGIGETEGALGGIVGQMKGRDVNSIASLDLSGLRSDASIFSRFYRGITCGGMIGYAENAVITGDQNEITINNPYMQLKTYRDVNSASQQHHIGGMIGKAKNVSITNFKSVNVSAITCSTQVTETIDGYDKFLKWDKGNIGGVIGTLELDGEFESTIENCNISDVTMRTTGNIGGIIGQTIWSQGASGTKNCTIKNVNVNGLYWTGANHPTVGDEATAVVGGIIGVNDAKNIIIEGSTIAGEKGSVIMSSIKGDHVQTEVEDVEFPITIDRDFQTLGGVIGQSNGGNCIIRNMETEINVNGKEKSQNFGGIVGTLGSENSKQEYTIENVKVSGAVSLKKTGFKDNETTFGGIIGMVNNNASVQLGGTLDVSAFSATVSSRYYGQIIGKKTDALIYVQPIEYAENQYQYGISSSNTFLADEVGNYGGLYRNGDWDAKTAGMDENTWLIQNHEIATKALGNNGEYNLTTAGDFMRVSIAAMTKGAYALACFGELSGTNELEKATSLMKSKFTVQNSIDLTGTKLYSLNGADSKAIAFGGEIKSVDMANPVTITLETISTYTQGNVGLFSNMESANVHDIKLNGSISFCSNYAIGTAGILAANAKNGNTLSNVEVENGSSIRDFDTINTADRVEYYGGLIGNYIYNGVESGTLPALKVSNITTKAALTSTSNQHSTGGVIGNISLQNTTTVDAEFDQITIGGSITNPLDIIADEQSRVGGMIATIIRGTSYDEDSTTINSDPKKELEIRNAKEATIIKLNLNIKNVNLDGVRIETTGTGTSGGFLGYSWENVNLAVAGATIQNNSSLTTKGTSGGLLQRICGKATLDQVKYDSATVEFMNNNNGLLVQNGQFAYISVKDYTLNKPGVTLNCTKTTDELVGVTIGDVNGDSYEYGGILSIEGKPELNYQYQSLDNSYKTQKNRYYYNLRTVLEGVQVKDNQLSTPQEVMAWHILHYANQYIRSYFTSTFANGYNEQNTEYTITKPIDLSGYSYYPTSIKGIEEKIDKYRGIDQASISFNGQKVRIDNEKANNVGKPSESASPHYMMQSGLFYHLSSTIEIDGLTLSGTVSRVGNTSGGMIAGSLSGNAKITNIIIKDLVVDNDLTSWMSPYGLLISQINAKAKLMMDHIRMQGYEEYDTGKSKVGQKVAAALIGTAGNKDATNMTLQFTNLDIADVADETTALTEIHASPKDQVLAYASLIYDYQYKATTVGIYNFNWLDYLYGTASNTTTAQQGIVTLGKEITETTEYYDYPTVVGVDAEVKPGNITDGDTIHFTASNYKPYVYTQESQALKVNEKTGDLLEGCGTYEDPYIIDKPTQLLALQNFFNGKFDLLGNWKVNQMGTDEKLCSKENHTELIYLVGTGFVVNDEFKTTKVELKQEQLSTAYYQVQTDINMTNYYDFNGLGASDMPFAGVIIGSQTTGSKNPVITMPSKKVTQNPQLQSTDQFGLVLYAKGTVIKDIDIEYPDVNYVNFTDEGTEVKAAGVIATIDGGDNVLDNVNVSGHLHIGGTNANIGGYVGLMNRGGLILRNLNLMNQAQVTDPQKTNYEIANVAKFKVYKESNEETSKVLYDETRNCEQMYTGAVVGNVKDGYIIYDNDSIDVTKPSIPMRVTYGTGEYLYGSRTYDIINGAYLDKEILENGNQKNIVKTDETATQIQFEMQNSAGMLVQSSLLNSGALHNNIKSTAKVTDAYNIYARCRTAQYINVGRVTDTADSDYKQAITYDNPKTRLLPGTTDKYSFQPYLYQYYDMQIELFDAKNSESKLVKNKNVLHKLTATNSVYDMQQFGSAFYGFGARKNTDNGFTGSFDGNNNTIKIRIYVDQVVGSSDVGLFTTLKNTAATPCSIQNFVIEGEVANTIEKASYDDINGWGIKINEDTTTDSINQSGLISSSLSGEYEIKNVHAKEFKVKGEGSTGGFFGKISGNNKISILECSLEGIEGQRSVVEGCTKVGGFVGFAAGNKELRVEDSYYDNINISSSSSDGNKSNGQLGGVVGANNATKLTVVGGNQANNNILGANSSVHAMGKWIGGIIGESLYSTRIVQIQNIKLSNLDIASSSASNVGGLIGGLNGQSNAETEIQNVSIEDSTISNQTGSTGGFIGMAKQKSILVHSTDINKKNKISGNTVIASNSAGSLFGELQLKSENGQGNISGLSINNNKIVTRSNKGNSGGVIGKLTTGLVDLYLDDIDISDNVIASAAGKTEAHMGGVVGKIEKGTETGATDTKNHWSNIKLKDNYIGYFLNNTDYSKVENIVSTPLKTLGENCRLWYSKDTTNNINTNTIKIENSAIGEESMPQYAMRIGNYVGSHPTNVNTYIINGNIETTPGMAMYLPMADVGSDTTITTLKEMYAYRQYCYIIAPPKSNEVNSLDSLEALWNNYKNPEKDRREVYRLNTPERYNNPNSINSQQYTFNLEKIYKDNYCDEESGVLSPFKYEDGTSYPMVVYNSKSEMMDTVIKGFLGILTNRGNDPMDKLTHGQNGGIIPTILNDIVQVTTTECKLSYNQETKRYELNEMKDTTQGPSVKFDSVERLFTREHEDSYNPVTKEGTITLIRVKYYNTPSVTQTSQPTVTINIPVHVQKVLRIENNTRYMEGKILSAQRVMQAGIVNGAQEPLQKPVITNSSIYTLYTEFAYNDARSDYVGTKFEKVFSLNAKNSQGKLSKNTRLTLIDLENNNKVYTYEVTDTTISEVSFNEFSPLNIGQDGLENTKYTPKDISEIQDTTDHNSLYEAIHGIEKMQGIGIERYLIIVDRSQVVSNVDAIYPANVIGKSEYKDALIRAKQLEYIDNLQVEIKEMPGFTMSFIKNKMTLDGTIKQDGKVEVSFEYSIEAINLFWDTFLKSSNNPYIEVSILLKKKMENGSSVVTPLPPGTQATLSSKGENPSKVNVGNRVNVFYYKDAGVQIPLKELAKKIGDTSNAMEKSSVTQSCDFSLDFRNAQLTDLEEGDYELVVELIETTDPKYPTNGSTRDIDSKTIIAEYKRDLGFSVTIDDPKDLTTNIFHIENQNKEKKIPHTVKLDFSEYIGEENAAIFNEFVKKNFTMVLQVEEKKKVDGKLIYDPIVDDTSIKITSKQISAQNMKADQVTEPGAVPIKNPIILEFTKEEIENGSNGTKGMIEFPFVLEISDLKAIDLTNYKVHAYLMVSDSPVSNASEVIGNEEALQDYFIFNIAKIKTDSDQ